MLFQRSDVLFAGYVPAEDLPRYYQACDVFCAPNTGQESFGIVLLEAMAAGAPIVASDIAGYHDVLTHGVEGLLVERQNPGALADALCRLLGDPELRSRMRRAGEAKARGYDWPRVAAQVLTTLRVDLAKVRTALEFIVGRGDDATSPSEITLSPRTKKVIELAVEEARRLNHSYIGTEHLLLGLVREGEGIAFGVLESLGVSLERPLE